ncbi:MAG: hypothetical protein ACTSR9_10475 [Candidatus Thorarchaeota archaeon]
MSGKTHPAAMEYALEQELYEQDEELFNDTQHFDAFFSRERHYLGSVKRNEEIVHYWFVHSTDEMIEIHVRKGAAIVNKTIENPLSRIP